MGKKKDKKKKEEKRYWKNSRNQSRNPGGYEKYKIKKAQEDFQSKSKKEQKKAVKDLKSNSKMQQRNPGQYTIQKAAQSSYDNKKDLKEAQKAWNNSRMQARMPAGYADHQSKVSGYEAKKNAGNISTASSKNKKDKKFETSPYKGSSEYKNNQNLIEQANKYKPQALDIASGSSDAQWVENQFKGSNPKNMPGDPKMPKLAKVKGYTGKERWAGPKTGAHFKPTLNMPKRKKFK